MLRLTHVWLLGIGLALALSSRATSVAEDDTLLVIVHPDVNAGPLSGDSLGAIYTMAKRGWPGGQNIVPYNYDPNSKLRIVFDQVVLGLDPGQSARFWVDHRIRGAGSPPRRVPSVALMVRVVSHLSGAIGYVPAGTPTTGTKVVARISNNRVQPVSER